MIFTKLFAIVAVVAATNVLAIPAAAPAALEERGISCSLGGNVLCNAVCKQEGNPKGGHCDANGTCICN